MKLEGSWMAPYPWQCESTQDDAWGLASVSVGPQHLLPDGWGASQDAPSADL